MKQNNFISLKLYFLIFLCIAAVGGIQMSVYFLLVNAGYTGPAILILSFIAYLAFMALIAGIIIVVVLYFSYEKPLRQLSEAINSVASGNFQVQLTSLPKDKKNNFIHTTYQDFNKMVETLNSIETLKSDFIANVSHEIKTPLSVIQMYASALQSSELSIAEKKEYTDTIMEASKKLSTLVTNILKLSKLENQEAKPICTTYNLSEQVRNCSLLYEDLWEQKKISFLVDLDEVMITSDEGMLELVWNNLIANAIKYTDKYGIITLTLRKMKHQVVVAVSDSGCGMDEKTKYSAFDKFYQGDTSHSQSGNGLGLALTRKVIERLNGKIMVESIQEKGSTFSVVLDCE